MSRGSASARAPPAALALLAAAFLAPVASAASPQPDEAFCVPRPPCLVAASATGDAEGRIAVSATGHAWGPFAVSGCRLTGVCGVPTLP